MKTFLFIIKHLILFAFLVIGIYCFELSILTLFGMLTPLSVLFTFYFAVLSSAINALTPIVMMIDGPTKV